MGFKDYKIRDGVHIPSDKYRKNYDAIFKKKKKQADMQSDNIEMEKLAEEQKYLKELKDKL
tara:strand:- start:186 stop:368 length:183 start_codon:yes stop_codon:yes gene_type:complete